MKYKQPLSPERHLTDNDDVAAKWGVAGWVGLAICLQFDRLKAKPNRWVVAIGFSFFKASNSNSVFSPKTNERWLSHRFAAVYAKSSEGKSTVMHETHSVHSRTNKKRCRPKKIAIKKTAFAECLNARVWE